MGILATLWRGHKDKPKTKAQVRLPDVQPTMTFVIDQPKRKTHMSAESYEKMMQLLTEMETLKEKEAQLKTERTSHQEQIRESEDEVARCNNELSDIRENQSRLRREMDTLRDEIFKREEEDTVVADNAHVVADGSVPSIESEGKKLWAERQRQLRKNTVG